MGVTFIEADGEADVQCAILNISNTIDGVISEDWDMVLFGCLKLLKNFFNKSNVLEIDIYVLLNELGMNLEQLIDLSTILEMITVWNTWIDPLEIYKAIFIIECI
jgi:DNA excision repair protein ERCC-5